MSTLMMGVLIFGLSGALAMLMKRKIEELFCFSICGVVLILYVFGIFGFLQAGVWTAIAVCLAGIAAINWFVIRGRFREVWARLATPGALVFGIIMIALYFGHKNRLFFYYDEFTHWGLALKNYWLMEAFPYGMESSTVHYQDYPPAITLFQYFWTKLAGGFNESDACRANNLLILSALLPCMKNIRWKQWASIIFMTVICAMLPLMFNSSAYAAALVDIPLGSFMIYALLSYHMGERDWISCLIACMALFVLTLMKASGVSFALIALAAMVLPELVGTQGDVKRRGWRTLGFVLASILIGVGSWKLYRIVCHVQPGRSIDVLGNLLALLQNGPAWYQQLALIAFGNVVMDASTAGADYAIPLSIVILIPLYGVIAYYACHKWMPKEEVRSGWVFHLTVALGAVVYLFLMTYLIAFPPDEAAMIASFSRYISAYLFAMFAILIFDILRHRWREDSSYGFPCAVAMRCVLCCVNPARIYPTMTMAQQHIKDGWDSREAIYKIDVSGMDPAKDRLYYVDQNGQSQQYWMERYVLTPLRVQSWAEPYTFTAETLTPEAWRQLLVDGGYTWVMWTRRLFKPMALCSERLMARTAL